jgi:hypothetical protein
MKNEKELKGQELVDFLMVRFNMTEDEALQSLAENIGNKKLEIGKDPIPFPIKFEILVNTKEYITKDEFDFIVAYDETERINFSYIGDFSKYGDYLNLNVYSEAAHQEEQLKKEI